MSKVQILVCAHKADANIRNNDVYKAIQVGCAINNIDLGYLKDNVGDNISERNPRWCELTALYWGWKNIKDTNYSGLAHYRRYFDIDITEENIESQIGSHDIIVGEPMLFNTTIFDHFVKWSTMEDYYLLIDTILTLFPDCKESIEKYIINSNRFIPFTMFIASKKVFDDFCGFVFPIVFELEKRLQSHNYVRLNRFIAYSGELLLGLYVTYKNLNVKYAPIIMNNERITTSFKSKLISEFHFKLLHPKFLPLEPIIPESIKVGYNGNGISLTYFK